MRILGSPFEDYILHWRIFRCMSNENSVFSDAVRKCELFNSSKFSEIIDIGTGDGDIMQRIIKSAPDKSYTLIEPSKEYMAITKILTAHYSNRIKYVEMRLGEITFTSSALFLAIHMIYLLADDELDFLLNFPNKGSDLILVVDAPESVFSQLWKECAPEYHNKCKIFYDKLKKHKYKITEIHSNVISPYNPEVKADELIHNAMLSTMCYNEYSNISQDKREKVRDILNSYTTNDAINCVSNLIEIPRN